jgi:hypothetical protein
MKRRPVGSSPQLLILPDRSAAAEAGFRGALDEPIGVISFTAAFGRVPLSVEVYDHGAAFAADGPGGKDGAHGDCRQVAHKGGGANTAPVPHNASWSGRPQHSHGAQYTADCLGLASLQCSE